MTPDSWERRNVPYSPGYNNPATGVQFTVSYDQGLDRLIVQSNFPVLGSLDSAQGEGETPDGNPGWTFNISSGNWIIDSASEAHLDGAWGFLIGNPGDDGDIQQLDFYDAGLVLIGTWTGSVIVTEPVPATPLIEDYSYVDYYDTQTAPPAFQSMGCGIVATGNAVPAIFFYGQNLTGTDGVQLIVDGSPVDYRLSTNPEYFGGPTIDDGFFLLADPALAGTQVTSAQPLDINGDPVGAPTVLQLNYNIAAKLGKRSYDTDTFEIVWDVCHDQPTQLQVQGCTPAIGAQYYDPAGPQSGLNPGAATIHQWDTNGIVIEHAAVFGAGDLNIVTTRDQYGRTLIILGDPIPEVDESAVYFNCGTDTLVVTFPEMSPAPDDMILRVLPDPPGTGTGLSSGDPGVTVTGNTWVVRDVYATFFGPPPTTYDYDAIDFSNDGGSTYPVSVVEPVSIIPPC